MTADEPVEAGRCPICRDVRHVAATPEECTALWLAYRTQRRPTSPSEPVESREQIREWPDPPYYAGDMARLLRDAADVPAFRAQGGDDYCKGLQRAAELVEEFGVQPVLSDDEPAGQGRRTEPSGIDWRDGNGESTAISRFMGSEVERVLAEHAVKPWQDRDVWATMSRAEPVMRDELIQAWSDRDTALAERDRARDFAADLEAENAHALAEVSRLREQGAEIRAVCADPCRGMGCTGNDDGHIDPDDILAILEAKKP